MPDLSFLPDQPRKKEIDLTFLPDQPKQKVDLSFLPDQPKPVSAEIAGEWGGEYVPETALELPAEIRAIWPTLQELVTSQVPFAKYLTEEGRGELKGEFFPPGTTTDPEKLKEILKGLVAGEKRISPYESLSQETMDALTWLAFPKALKIAGAMAKQYLPKKFVEILTKNLKLPWAKPKVEMPVEAKPEAGIERPIAPRGETSISIEQLEKNPNLADYVVKRPEIHDLAVLERAREISKTGKISIETAREMAKPQEAPSEILPAEAPSKILKEAPSPESLEAQVKGGPAGPLPKYAEGSSINLERIKTTDDVKHFMNGITKSIEEKIGKKKVSWEETRTKAEELGWDVSALKKAWQRKGSFSAAEIDAARQTNINAISELHEMLRTLPAERTGYTPEMRAKLFDALEAVKVTSQASSEAGRALNIHKRILAKDPEFKEASEINRVLKVLSGKEVPRTDAIIDALRQINFDNPADVNRFIYNVTKNKWQKLSDGAYELWINGLLSNPLSHIVNTTSNALTLAASYPERLIGTGIEAVRAAITKTPRERFAKETIQDSFSFIKGLHDGTKRFFDAMRKGEISGGKTEVTRVSALPLKVQPYTPGRALMAEDVFFKGFIENQELNRLAMRKALQEGLLGDARKQRIIDLLANPTEEMLEQSAIKAKYLTYQKDLGKIGNFVLKARDNVPGLKYFIPFVRTPTNIAKYALERTPLNIPRVAYKTARGELKGGEFSDEAAKALVGSLISGGIYLLAEEGVITGGGPKGKAERDELYRTGWLPYAFHIGDKYYSFARLEPIGSIFGMAADMSELKKHAKEDEKFSIAGGIGASITKNISNKTFAQGFSQISDFISDPGKYGEKQIESLAGSIIPSLSAGVARSIDDELKNPKGIVDAIKSRIPEVSKTVEPKVDIWGEPIERPGTAVSRFISPVQISEEKGTSIDRELTKLKLNLGMPSKKMGNSELNEEEYSEVVRISGQKSKKELNQLIRTNSYKNMSNEEKEKEIKSIVSENRDKAKKLIFRNMSPARRKEIKEKILELP